MKQKQERKYPAYKPAGRVPTQTWITFEEAQILTVHASLLTYKNNGVRVSYQEVKQELFRRYVEAIKARQQDPASPETLSLAGLL